MPKRSARLWTVDVVHLLVFLAGVIAFHEVRMAWGWLAAIGVGVLLFIATRWLGALRRRFE